jgi:hypothetical protein
MRKLIAGTVVVAVGALSAGPAFAAPSNAKSSLTFVGVECENLNSGETLTTDFVVNGNGDWGAAHSPEGTFQPLALDLTFTGPFGTESESLAKNNVGKANWTCSGQATITDPEFGDFTITFVALGNFH